MHNEPNPQLCQALSTKILLFLGCVVNIDNFRRLLDQANQADIEAGIQSWFTYNRLIRGIACKHQAQINTTAGIFSALSPNNDYFGNLRDTDRLLGAFKKGLSVEQTKVSTYNGNKKKAWSIA